MVQFEYGLRQSTAILAGLVGVDPVKTDFSRSRPVSVGLVGFEPVKTGLNRSGSV